MPLKECILKNIFSIIFIKNSQLTITICTHFQECYQNCQFEEELKKYGCVTLKVNLAHKEKLCLDKLHLGR